jgi:hypothetical protein
VSAKLQQVHVRVNDAATGKPTPCRIRFTDAEGNYFAPHGRVAKAPRDLDHPVGGNVYSGTKLYACIDGCCEIALPPGVIRVVIAKGPEYEPVDKEVALAPGKLALRFDLERVIDSEACGWHSGAMALTTLSPHEVLLEAAAEGLRVVDLLAFERRVETTIDYPNLIAFSGQRPCLETPACLLAVNTLNGHQMLGGLALLNCHRPVFPLRFGDEPAPNNWTLADWCDQCHRKRGLVIALNVDWWEKWDGGELLADLLLGKIDAVGLGELFVESIQWWYTLLSLGLRVPIVAGVSTRTFSRLIGRTYARLGPSQELSYPNWIEAIRMGRTALSDGTFLTVTTNGEDPGAIIQLDGPDAVVRVHAEARARENFDQLEIIQDGIVVMTQVPSSGKVFHAEMDAELRVSHSGWLAARCTNRPHPEFQQLLAHTSPVYVCVDHQPLPPDADAARTVNDLLDRTLAWVLHNAICETPKDRERLASIFVEAKRVLQVPRDGPG